MSIENAHTILIQIPQLVIERKSKWPDDIFLDISNWKDRKSSKCADFIISSFGDQCSQLNGTSDTKLFLRKLNNLHDKIGIMKLSLKIYNRAIRNPLNCLLLEAKLGKKNVLPSPDQNLQISVGRDITYRERVEAIFQTIFFKDKS